MAHTLADTEPSPLILQVHADDDGVRLDQWLKAQFPQLGHGTVQKWLRRGAVRVQGVRAKNARRVRAGETITLPPVTPVTSAATAPAPRNMDTHFIRSLVLHKTDDWLAIDKPAGLAVQGGSHTHRHLDGWLEALRFGAAVRPRLVHRLDKATSGVLLLARHRIAAQTLTRAFAQRRIAKLYWGLVHPVPKAPTGCLTMPLRKTGQAGTGRMQVSHKDAPRAQLAETRYRVEATKAGYAFMVLQPITGRTHQLRAHSAAAGWPLVGDTRYGTAAPAMLGKGLHLHAHALAVPQSNAPPLELRAPLPPHMQHSWQALGLAPANTNWLVPPGKG